MAQESEITLSFYASGYCEAHASIVDPIHGKGKKKFYAVWAFIKIPDVGNVLFDTGYSEEFNAATRRFPNLFRSMASVSVHSPLSQAAKTSPTACSARSNA